MDAFQGGPTSALARRLEGFAIAPVYLSRLGVDNPRDMESDRPPGSRVKVYWLEGTVIPRRKRS